jgi:2-keto-3-deoxy-L-rhamnonate aldolase RhmA
MKTNPLKVALAAGGTQLGTWLQMERNPAILPLLKSAGIDFIRFEMEHASASIETVANMALLARALDMGFFVRPPMGNREWITRLLDAGVWGLQVPQVDTPELAREAVDAAYYAPLGHRGMVGLGPQIDFTPFANTRDQLAYLNDQVHITVMLESAEAFRNVDTIVSTPGVDSVTLGPNDLAQDLGVLESPDRAAIIDSHRDILLDAAKRHGKEPMFTVQSLEELAHWRRRGVRLLAYASETSILYQGFSAVNKADSAG